MRSFIYKCPATGTTVHTRVAKNLIGPDTVSVPMDCPVCNRSHLISPADCEEPGDDDGLSARKAAPQIVDQNWKFAYQCSQHHAAVLHVRDTNHLSIPPNNVAMKSVTHSLNYQEKIIGDLRWIGDLKTGAFC